jgi:hypothetical protein
MPPSDFRASYTLVKTLVIKQFVAKLFTDFRELSVITLPLLCSENPVAHFDTMALCT